ncbi:MAG: CpXC domain-containing protein [Candidatus Thorarchaeota archaeon]
MMTQKAEVTCKKCGHEFEAEVIDHVDLSEDKHLIRSIRSGTANRVKCPRCGVEMDLDRSIVINFEPQNRIVLFDKGAESGDFRESLKSSYNNIIEYNEILSEVGKEVDFRIISNLGELRQLLEAYLDLFG